MEQNKLINPMWRNAAVNKRIMQIITERTFFSMTHPPSPSSSSSSSTSPSLSSLSLTSPSQSSLSSTSPSSPFRHCL
ncbi:unnamed protein product [Cercopithifilaria johnstoni]|uniref:Uncharacterized protein n=1 Tax=Cercopithifilaria johnstoni TaxID=2874296 RepID=A0A8J2LNE7_9BILA|nr:unnamed protein product [Cercopithifilaria johnstoni]